MKRETAKRLLDVQTACEEILQFSAGQDLSSFLENRQLQLSLHKLLENIGEALNQLAKTDSEVAVRIPDLHRFVSLRHRITHGYDTVNYEIIWNVSIERIPALQQLVIRLQQEAPPVE